MTRQERYAQLQKRADFIGQHSPTRFSLLYTGRHGDIAHKAHLLYKTLNARDACIATTDDPRCHYYAVM